MIPGAPWQKWTNLVFWEPAEVEKFLLIKCLIKNFIEADISWNIYYTF